LANFNFSFRIYLHMELFCMNINFNSNFTNLECPNAFIQGFLGLVILSAPYFFLRHLKGTRKTSCFWKVALIISFVPCFPLLVLCMPLLFALVVFHKWASCNGHYTIKSYVGHEMATEYAKIHTQLMRKSWEPNYSGFYSKSTEYIKEHMAKEAFNEGHVMFHGKTPVACGSITIIEIDGVHAVECGCATSPDYQKLNLYKYIVAFSYCSPRSLCYQLWTTFLNENLIFASVYASPISYSVMAKNHEMYPSVAYPTKESFPGKFGAVFDKVLEAMYAIPEEPNTEFSTACSFPGITKFDANRGNAHTDFYLKSMNPQYPANTQFPLALIPITFGTWLLGSIYRLLTVKTKAPQVAEPMKYEGKLVAIVDPVSSGGYLAKHLMKNGAKVICISTAGCDIDVQPGQAFVDEFMHQSIDATVARIKSFGEIDGVLIGYDTGVTIAEQLAAKMGLRGNKPSFDRRNKFLQQEKCRSFGIDAAKQTFATTMAEVDEFLSTFNPTPFKAIVKPVDGAGTMSVVLCQSPDEVREAFSDLIGLVCFGNVCEGALIQEFLAGTEYVVNTVTVDGNHKAVGVFQYDRRHAYGSDFVYFGARAMGDDHPHFVSMIDYALNVLNAMEFDNGAAHLEIMLTNRGPVLVECNCRIAGCSGNMDKCEELVSGRGQIELYADAMLEPSCFASIPEIPQIQGDALISFYHVNGEGKMEATNQETFYKVKNLSSYVKDKVWLTVGNDVVKTSGDMDTLLGAVVLYNKDSAQLEKDIEMVHEFNAQNLFVKLSTHLEPRGVLKLTDPSSEAM